MSAIQPRNLPSGRPVHQCGAGTYLPEEFDLRPFPLLPLFTYSLNYLTFPVPGDGPQRPAVRVDADGSDADQNRHTERHASMFVLHLHGPN